MLQSDLDDPIRFLCRFQALISLRNRPRHGFFRIQISAGSKRIHKMPRMNMQGAGNNDAVDIFHVKQATMIVQRLNTWCCFLCFFATTTVDIGNCYQLNIAQF